MESLRTDSPLTRRVVRSFLQFLSSVQAAPGVDREDIEVAAQCLSEVFKINQQHDGDDDNSPLPSLPDLITAAAHTSSLGLVQSEDSDRVMADAAAAEEPIAAESPMTATTPAAAPNSSSMFALNNQNLWEQFRHGLEWCGYFGGVPEGSPEYVARMRAAETTFQDSLKKYRDSATLSTDQKDAQILAEAFKVQGNASMKQQRFSDAIQFYTLAISLCNDNAIFYANRAAAHSEVSKFAEAIADCEDAIRIDPKYSKAYSRLGWVYHAQGHFQEAIEKGFQKALNLDPNNATAKENLMAAQQKLAEQQRDQSYQQQEPQQQGQNPFGQQGGIPGFGGAMPGNIQLPPEMANLIPGIMNLAAQFNQRQQQQESNMQPGDESHENGGEQGLGDDDISVNTSINFTVNGQELPPEFAGLMGSVLQMFGGVNGGAAGSNPNTPGSPGGGI
ncbi:unnamed protein product [Sphagnum jensenii]|uniref:SGTA homodimerisation domain-containing protein n=1 Tax=Sphagnum jensenii TaxID=128206 RepID=A0ABP0WR84_9BRYO